MDLDGVSIDIIKGDAHNISPPKPKPEGDSFDQNLQSRYFFRHLFKAVLLFTLVTIACFVLFNQGGAAGSPFQFLPTSFYNFTFSHAYNSTAPPPAVTGMEELGLEQLLKRAAMPDKTVILSPLNEAWIEKDSIFDLFLESFRVGNQTIGLLKHLIVVALDQKAFDHCLGLHLNCYFLKTQGVDFSGEAHFMSADYLKIVWRKIDFLRTVLETGYSFVFTDADIMWFRNPFQQFYPDSHFQVACDKFRGNPWDLNNAPNTGLMYVKSSNQTIEFYKYWYKSREIYSAKHDQDAFNMIKRDPVVRDIGLQIKFLDTAYFGGFCQSSRNFDLVYTMHANCCAGLDNKIHDLKILLEDWKKYISFTENEKISHPISWSVPQSCGPASFRSHTPWKKNGT
ncbi:hypothetical protein RD792_001591 [Penstemon davidsonii]|uniref:Nucleotide-diphospho-sugar transferase domain-containing protein n=1 Tax=Penstemon davidsonii TaxID=160366 RepID=A0ABR0DNU7_9LAMI|nr:hypothetical protein RD792_001591 [Penstemon davidsonii]